MPAGVSKDARRFCSWSALPVLGLVLLFAACQPLPRPFAPEPGGAANPLLGMDDRGGIVVLEVDGLAGDGGAALARAMVDALHAENVPASIRGGNRESRFLQGRIEAQRSGGQVALVWELFDGSGALVGEAAHTAPADALGAEASPDLLRRLAAAAALHVAALIQDAAPTDGGAPALALVGATGAPGDGDAALERAMAAALAARGVALAEAPGPGVPALAAEIDAGPEAHGRRPIAIVWRLRDAAGRELATLRQANAAPARTLESRWGALAEIIAAAAADDVVRLLARPGFPVYSPRTP